MLSLANARSADDIEAWELRIRNLLKRYDITAEQISYVTEPKIDGLAISLTYEDGVFVRGTTRGDGKIGEDVSQNLRTIRSIPLRIPDAPAVIEVRGEIYFPRSGFERLNEQRAEAGLPTFANPRNAAAGTIRQQDPQLAAERPLQIWVYGIGSPPGGRSRHPQRRDRVAARARLPGQRRHRDAGERGGGRRALQVVGGEPRAPRLRDRRRRRQGRRPGALARARRRRARAALGDRVEVPADDGDDDAQRDRLERRTDGPHGAVRDARAGSRRRRHREHRDPPQRGGSRSQGRARRRRGRDHQSRGRDPAGDRTADPASQGQAVAEAEATQEVPGVRNRDRQARGRLDDLPEPHRLPRSGLPAHQALRPPRVRWTSMASARSRPSDSSRTG